MKKLEKTILKKIYGFEAKRTIVEVIFRIGSLILVITTGIVVASALIKQLVEQQTLDLLQLFQEDVEIIKQYLGDVLDTFYQELPKNEVILTVILLVVFIFFLLLFIKNFEKMSNRIKALKKYWLK